MWPNSSWRSGPRCPPPERYPLGQGRRWEKSRNKMMYALRHLYASMMINGGVDVYTLADRLGHADPE